MHVLGMDSGRLPILWTSPFCMVMFRVVNTQQWRLKCVEPSAVVQDYELTDIFVNIKNTQLLTVLIVICIFCLFLINCNILEVVVSTHLWSVLQNFEEVLSTGKALPAYWQGMIVHNDCQEDGHSPVNYIWVRGF